MKKVENDEFLAPSPTQEDETKQLEMFRYIRPLAPEVTTNLAAEVLEAVRQQRQERQSIASELFPDLDPKNDFSLTIEQIRAITEVYFNRYPDRRPRSPEMEPKQQKGRYFVFTIFWCNPYTEPPKNKPKCLLEVRSECDRLDSRAQSKFDIVLSRNPGYSQGWSSFEHEQVIQSRKWSEERKIANRRRLLEKRVRAKFSIPELADEEIQRQVMMRPEYFGVEPLLIPINVKAAEAEIDWLEIPAAEKGRSNTTYLA